MPETFSWVVVDENTTPALGCLFARSRISNGVRSTIENGGVSAPASTQAPVSAAWRAVTPRLSQPERVLHEDEYV